MGIVGDWGPMIGGGVSGYSGPAPIPPRTLTVVGETRKEKGSPRRSMVGHELCGTAAEIVFETKEKRRAS